VQPRNERLPQSRHIYDSSVVARIVRKQLEARTALLAFSFKTSRPWCYLLERNDSRPSFPSSSTLACLRSGGNKAFSASNPGSCCGNLGVRA
jgi:hypothetical protein